MNGRERDALNAPFFADVIRAAGKCDIEISEEQVKFVMIYLMTEGITPNLITNDDGKPIYCTF